MRQTITTLAFLVFSLHILAQTQKKSKGPVVPGYYDYHICDADNDGSETFDLVAHFIFPFSEFSEDPNNYHPLTFYITEEDRDNEVNEIVNPSSFVNTKRSQRIYFRAYAIVAGDYEYLDGDSTINADPLPTLMSGYELVECDENGNGINEFNLNRATNRILEGLSQNTYSVRFYETLLDAENTVNAITTTRYENSSNPQTVFVRVDNRYANGCSSIAELDLVVNNICMDIGVYLVSSNRDPRPGFVNSYSIIIKNEGNSVFPSGRINFINDFRQELVSFSSGVATTNGFYYDINNLNINGTIEIELELRTLLSTQLGVEVNNSVRFTGEDYILNNNYDQVKEIVVGSYDPNDINESHGPEILHSSFSSDDYLFYTIRFQNVGTADAINVSIDNTLNADLDETSIVMLSSSHSNVFTRTGNALNWQFDNIHLPSEDMDEPNSHGYVYYKIKPKAGYSVGDIIPNTAEIYFDFNPAVVTKTFETEFVTTLSNSGNVLETFAIYPNPANHFVKLSFDNTINEFETNIYDISGKKVLTNRNALSVDVSGLKTGLYFFEVKTSEVKVTEKLIIK